MNPESLSDMLSVLLREGSTLVIIHDERGYRVTFFSNDDAEPVYASQPHDEIVYAVAETMFSLIHAETEITAEFTDEEEEEKEKLN